MSSGIYIITNTESGKFYIGSTVNFQERWTNHRNQLRRKQHANPHLQHAWNKYGKNAFEFDILEYMDDHKELHLAEQFWMDIYRLEGKKLYNCGLAARSPWLGRHHTEETRRKISEGNKGKIVSKETRAKISKGKIGCYPSEETRIKLSRARAGRTLSEETKCKISKSNKGKRKGQHLSIEAKKKLSDAFAKPYPAFYNERTGETIPKDMNLRALCRERNLDRSSMWKVMRGQLHQYKGWILSEKE